MKKAAVPQPPPARTWRSIPQSVPARALTPAGRRRFAFNTMHTLWLAVAVVLLAAGTWYALRVFPQRPGRLANAAGAEPVRHVTLVTDGVLDEAWVGQTLALPDKATLVDLDLSALQARLLDHGQVRDAVVSRRFPSTLSVKLTERVPVVRLNLEVSPGQPETWVVSADGVVYLPLKEDPRTLAELPWLAGVHVDTLDAGKRYSPIPNMDAVTRLLVSAAQDAPHLRRQWRVLDLSHLQSDGQIVVQSTSAQSIVFDARGDLLKQFARLDYVLDAAAAATDRSIESVNLALGSQVPVVLDDEPPPLSLPSGNKSSASQRNALASHRF